MGLIEESEYLGKTLFSCMVPLIVSTIFAAVFVLVKFIKNSSNLKRNIVISMITISYFFHPTLTEKIIGLFKCTDIEGVSRFTYDLELVCWEGIHLKFVVFLAIPMIFVWVLGLPILGISFLTIKRQSLLDENFKKYT